MKIEVNHKKNLPSAVKRLLKYSGNKRIFAFYGSLGAGKTTIIKEICKQLGASDITSSPSFTMVNEYRTPEGKSLYHIDFYRVRNTGEVFDFGIEEYLYGGSYCFMEWPDLVEELLPIDTVKIHIIVGKNEKRILELFLT